MKRNLQRGEKELIPFLTGKKKKQLNQKKKREKRERGGSLRAEGYVRFHIVDIPSRNQRISVPTSLGQA